MIFSQLWLLRKYPIKKGQGVHIHNIIQLLCFMGPLEQMHILNNVMLLIIIVFILVYTSST